MPGFLPFEPPKVALSACLEALVQKGSLKRVKGSTPLYRWTALGPVTRSTSRLPDPSNLSALLEEIVDAARKQVVEGGRATTFLYASAETNRFL